MTGQDWKKILENRLKENCPETIFSEKELGWVDFSDLFGYTVSVNFTQSIHDLYLNQVYYQLADDKYLRLEDRIEDIFEIEILGVERFWDGPAPKATGRIRDLGSTAFYPPNGEGEGYYKFFASGGYENLEGDLSQLLPLLGLAQVPGKTHYEKQYDESSPSYRFVSMPDHRQ